MDWAGGFVVVDQIVVILARFRDRDRNRMFLGMVVRDDEPPSRGRAGQTSAQGANPKQGPGPGQDRSTRPLGGHMLGLTRGDVGIVGAPRDSRRHVGRGPRLVVSLLSSRPP